MKKKAQKTDKPSAKFKTFRNNGVLFCFALVASVICWFIVSTQNVSKDAPLIIYDVPITIQSSDVAITEDLQVFTQSETVANVRVSSVGQVGKNPTAEDFEVIGTFAPSSTKTGSALKNEVITLRARKKNPLSEVDILSIDPEEITVGYDKSIEKKFKIESEIKYTADSGFYAFEPSLSETEVEVSGPASAVSNIGRVAVKKELTSALKQDFRFIGELMLYDREEKPIVDFSSMNLTLNTATVDVNLIVQPKKMIKLAADITGLPEGFAKTRVSVLPETIEIAGEADVLAELGDVWQLASVFEMRDVNMENRLFEGDIVLPAGVRNITNEKAAKIEVNLNGYKEVQLDINGIKLNHVPATKVAEPVTKTLTVRVVGSEAQINTLTADMISASVEMAGKTDVDGTIELPVSFTVNGANTCWVSGKYSAAISISSTAQSAKTNNERPGEEVGNLKKTSSLSNGVD